MRKQEQVLSVIALLLFIGVFLYHVLSSPLHYDVTVEEEVTSETVVATTTVSSAVSEAATETPGIDAFGRVNLNTATLQDLTSLPGIGDAKAQAILEDRSENGPFSSIEDLTRVSGIGEKTFEKLKDRITV